MLKPGVLFNRSDSESLQELCRESRAVNGAIIAIIALFRLVAETRAVRVCLTASPGGVFVPPFGPRCQRAADDGRHSTGVPGAGGRQPRSRSLSRGSGRPEAGTRLPRAAAAAAADRGQQPPALRGAAGAGGQRRRGPLTAPAAQSPFPPTGDPRPPSLSALW